MRPEPRRGAAAASAPPGARPRAIHLVHVTTAPETLRFLAGHPGYLRARGFEVSAISSPGPLLDAFGLGEGVACVGIRMERGISPLRDLVALARVWRALRRIRPDVVDAHTPKAGLLGMVAASLAGVPIRIYHLHGLRFVTTAGAQRALLRTTERLAAALATRVLCVSRSLAAVAVEERLAAPGKVDVLLGGSIAGVDAARFRPPTPADRRRAREALGIPAGACVVGFVGRLARDKGVVELAGAWRALRAERPDLRLVLVGPDEPDDPVPPEVAAELRSDPRVLVAGLDWDTPRYYRAMDVLALPSHREGFGLVALEAAAMGVPVVATRIAGCVDAVVDGITGTLVPARDPDALAAAIRAYASDPSLRRRHGDAGRARALREFDRERLWDALHHEYMRLVEASRAGA